MRLRANGTDMQGHREPTSIAVIGAGQIGTAIAPTLAKTTGLRVTLADFDARQLDRVPAGDFARDVLDAADEEALRAFLADYDIVVSACPFYLNERIAQAAYLTETHYFDLTEDVRATARIRELAREAACAFVPQCGLAPGFIGIVGYAMATSFDRAHSIKLRVGALPQYPTNPLLYNVTWSVDGLVNEYCNPCELIADGELRSGTPLEDCESVLINGTPYEAFNTSGGLGTLAETLYHRVNELSYKTLRYPGHAEIMRLLLHGLRLAEDRPVLHRILSKAAPFTHKDVVVVFVTGIGERGERMVEESLVHRYYGDGTTSAIQLTTSAGLCGMVELFLAGKLPRRGFVAQEQAQLADFLATPSGSAYAREGSDDDLLAWTRVS